MQIIAIYQILQILSFNSHTMKYNEYFFFFLFILSANERVNFCKRFLSPSVETLTRIFLILELILEKYSLFLSIDTLLGPINKLLNKKYHLLVDQAATLK